MNVTTGLRIMPVGTTRITFGPACFGASVLALGAAAMLAAESSQESPQGFPRGEQGPRRVFRDRITPHWCASDQRFWYRNDLRDGAKEFVAVDAERGVREPAFDHAKLAAALSKAAGKDFRADKLPFDNIAFVEGGKVVAFKVGDP